MGAPLIIVALGDSTTAGTPGFLSPLEAPPDGRGNPESQFSHWLERLNPGWRVLNRGIDGQRSDEILQRFHRDVLPPGPHYVIILAGVNDIYQGVASAVVQRNLKALYRRALEASIVPVASTVLPYNTASEEATHAISEVNAWIAATAASLEIPWCDTHAAAADPNNPSRLRGSPDGLHPDVGGYRRIGEGLARTIEEHLWQGSVKGPPTHRRRTG